jgi:hypothetical protein
MGKRALIHIGMEKTGTTSLQAFFAANRDLLKANGVAYLRSPGIKNHLKLVTYCLNINVVDSLVKDLGLTSKALRLQWREEFKQEFQEEIKNLNHSIDNIVISSEHFHSRLHSIEEIQELQILLNEFCYEIKIIVYLRRQDLVATSLFSTGVKVGVSRNNVLKDNISPEDIYYNYYNLLEKWSNVFGQENIILRVFEKEKLVNGDTVDDFILNSQILKKYIPLVRPKNENESISSIAQNITIIFNKHFPKYINNKNNYFANQIRNAIIKKINKNFPGVGKMPTKKEAVNFYKIFAKSNNQLARKWFNREELFSEDFSRYPEKEPLISIDIQHLNIIFIELAKVLEKHLFLSKNSLDKIDLKEDPGIVFRDLATSFRDSHPQIARFLLLEAKKYRPEDSVIQKKLQELELELQEMKN